jgi:hypothetical protein
MTLDDEVMAVENLVHAARDAATEHLERATKDLHLGSTALAWIFTTQDRLTKGTSEPVKGTRS